MNRENLQASIVMVHPDLQNDVLKNQGKIAVVNYDRDLNNDIYVAFENGQEAVYHPSELLVLKDKQEVFNDLTANGSKMEPNDFRALYKIMLLQERNTPQANWDALLIARDNPGVWEHALETPGRKNSVELNKAFTR
ncbi:hypothetical protein [Mucilaginibacter terrae]|uniref:Uncharacterized protein n=1 Tax=Mucilaginibacter terrae TaxID=1955052 RepID=A0ABU3GND6_9SPHI|nr:hypothetical protein [Mucilaginibacter terrae]MDT3401293.1 hypothetical protein [Mucilaginibacter terrae]